VDVDGLDCATGGGDASGVVFGSGGEDGGPGLRTTDPAVAGPALFGADDPQSSHAPTEATTRNPPAITSVPAETRDFPGW
jgi:hypothetical protein